MKVYGNKLKNIGNALIASRKNLFKQIYETSNLIREIKIYSNYNFFLNKFKIEHSKLIQRNLRRLLITSMPKYFLEISTVIFIFLIIYFEIEVEKKKISELITVLALLIISSLRVLPIVNSSVQKISNLKTLNVSFSLVLEILNSHQNNLDYPTTIISNDSKNFDCILEFKEFSFNYGKDVIFEKQNIKIFKQSIIGIYGKSGGGKSTVLDLLCGIIQPSEGDIFFKNNKVNQISDVDLNIALVSQNSQLLNLTIAENIAFGVQKEKIDRNSIQSIIELVGLKDFILNKKEGLDFIIDDNSGNLSGGQIQRLSIARALYRQPELLLLDEPTSSLDEKNSKNIKNLIYNLRNLTRSIIIVSHDKDLLDKCDYIYEIKNNKIILS
jgi:ABC-type bacteriocin/lantibiotic exporter with double-glycine peptidase domain